MVTSTLYRHMSVRALALHAQRIGRAFAHASTWHKLIRERALQRPRRRVYPLAAVGNGDDVGLYWPEGCAHGSPTIMSSSHDVYGFIPEANSFEALLHKRSAELQWERAEVGSNEDDADDSASERQAIASIVDVSGLEELSRPSSREDSFRTRHRIDPYSAFLCTAVADLQVAAGELADAEARYRRALERFPTYTAARYGLGLLLRRERRAAEALHEFARVLVSPVQLDGRSFWADFILPMNRTDLYAKAQRFITSAKRAPDLPDDLALVWERAPVLDFSYHPSNPPNWRPLAELIEQLATAGHMELAISAQQSLAPSLLYCEGDFHLDACLARQSDLYQVAGDASRVKYLNAFRVAS